MPEGVHGMAWQGRDVRMHGDAWWFIITGRKTGRAPPQFMGPLRESPPPSSLAVGPGSQQYHRHHGSHNVTITIAAVRRCHLCQRVVVHVYCGLYNAMVVFI
jgi:hypothetical protein